MWEESEVVFEDCGDNCSKCGDNCGECEMIDCGECGDD